ncbi:hypothetical protein DIPPA_06208 [Diplonema papillatum]|nr:hypothetical protein DIPPA_35583 [Diplonema papillatum]KAJ9466977.1 hypothetical protein DIPPA_06208 [Diplonema papillatum]
MTPLSYLEQHVLDDRRIVTNSELRAAYGLRQEQATDVIVSFSHREGTRVMLLYSEMSMSHAGGELGIRITCTPTVETAVLYGVASSAWQKNSLAGPLVRIPQDHAPPIPSAPLIGLPANYQKRPLDNPKKRSFRSGPEQPSNAAHAKSKRQKTICIDDDDDDCIIIE